MTRRQLYALFVCSLMPGLVGNGLLPILPLYASQLGASPAFVGSYLSLSYVALAAGTMSGGWLADRIQRRKLQLVLFSATSVPPFILMGHVANAWQLAALTSLVWFLVAVGMTTVGTLAGLSAEIEERGRVFGILATTPAVGALLGGAMAGPILDRWGYGALFGVLGLLFAIQPLSGLLLKEPPPVSRGKGEAAAPAAPLGVAFYLFMTAATLTGVGLFIGRMGTSLSMHGLGFLATAISSTTVAGGLVTLPLAIYLGRLSDRLNRRLLLSLCYGAGAAGVCLLTLATALWQFWLAATLLSIMSYVGTGVGSALVTDLVPREGLGKSLALFQTTSWVGGIVGFAVAGFAIERFGGAPTFIAAGLTQLAAIALLAPGAKPAPVALQGP